MKPGSIQKLKTVKRATNSDCSYHRHNTKIQSMCIYIYIYIEFLTPLTPFVEKIVDLHGFKYVYKPQNINVLFSQCGS